MEGLGDIGGTNSLIKKLKEKKLDKEFYKTNSYSQGIAFDHSKGFKERENLKFQEENNKSQEEEKSEVLPSSSKSPSSKSSEDSKINTENNQMYLIFIAYQYYFNLKMKTKLIINALIIKL